MSPEATRYKRDDFVSDQQVRWCPGCGDYSILAAVQRTLAKFDTPKENHVFISGIGCSSRFPYYMNTYGFHTIHGRAPTIASGLKCANKDLTVWVITGDGDGLSIGGNHLIHCMRRNINLNIILVNNRIYGLTKGQYSPTSEAGKITKSSPLGSLDYPINPLCVAIASEATFVARSLDSDPKHLSHMIERSMQHKGTSFLEVYQNCNIFNDKAYTPVTSRETREDRMLYLEHGQPLIFGKERDKAISLKGLKIDVTAVNQSGAQDIVTHNEVMDNPYYAYLLTQMEYPDMPVPFGVFRSIERATYDDLLDEQIENEISIKGKGNLTELINGSNTWKV